MSKVQQITAVYNTLPQTIMEAAQASLVEENSLPGAYVPLP